MEAFILLFGIVALVVFVGLPIMMIFMLVKIIPRSIKLMKIRLKKIDQYIEENEE